jgi:hypothetical protein
MYITFLSLVITSGRATFLYLFASEYFICLGMKRRQGGAALYVQSDKAHSLRHLSTDERT